MKTVDKETLKSWLGQPDLFLMDVRSADGWGRSIAKIEYAHRFDPERLSKMARDIPKNKKLVLYCENGETSCPIMAKSWRRWGLRIYISWKAAFGPGGEKNFPRCLKN